MLFGSSCSDVLVHLDCLLIGSEGWLSGGLGSGILVDSDGWLPSSIDRLVCVCMKYVHCLVKRNVLCSLLLLTLTRWLLNRLVVTCLIIVSLVGIHSWSSSRFYLALLFYLNGCSIGQFKLRHTASFVQRLYWEYSFAFIIPTHHFNYHSSVVSI